VKRGGSNGDTAQGFIQRKPLTIADDENQTGKWVRERETTFWWAQGDRIKLIQDADY
jgi:hypothetical protein